MSVFPRPHRFSLTLMAVTFVGAWAISAPAAAQDDAYKKGLEARDKERWPEVATQMRRAIDAEKSETDKKKFKVGGLGPFGGTEYPYLPHYFLGEALMAQNDCAGAIVAFSESERQGVVTGQRLVTLRTHYQTCAAQGVLPPAAFEPLRQRTNQKYVEAMALFNRIAARASANKTLAGPAADDSLERARKAIEDSYKKLTDGTRSRRQADFSESAAAADRGAEILRRLDATMATALDTQNSARRQLQELEQFIAAADTADKTLDSVGSLSAAMLTTRKNGQGELAEARRAYATGQRAANVTVVKEGIDHARSAANIFNELLGQAQRRAEGVRDKQRADAVRNAGRAMASIDDAFVAFDRRVTLETAPPPEAMQTNRATLRKDADALERRIAAAAAAGDVAGLTQATGRAAEIRARIEALVQELPPLSLRARGIPEGMEEGARLYLRGEYQDALAALDSVAAVDVSMQVHLHLFKAAARYGLYVRSGETKKELLDQTIAEIEQCKRIDAAFTPDTRAFGPRFIQLYEQGRQAVAR